MALPFKLRHWFNVTFTSTLDLLYPPKCAGCDIIGAGVWCPQCERQVQTLLPPDHVQTLDLGAGGTMAVLSAAGFDSPLREAIHEFKYNGTPALAAPLSRYLVLAWRRVSWPIDLIIPVPLHTRRRRERGYNQSEFLAIELARVIGLRINTSVLRRTRHTEQQAHLDAETRQQNVADAFAAAPGLVEGKRVLLVDDVLTTGSTLRACAVTLLQSGAADVSAMTLARA